MKYLFQHKLWGIGLSPKDSQHMNHATYTIILGKDKEIMSEKSASDYLQTDFQVKLWNWSTDTKYCLLKTYPKHITDYVM